MARPDAEREVGEPVVIDVRGLKCPLPVLKTEKRMRAFEPGTRFVVLTTDPMAAIDMPHFCGENRHALLTSTREGNVLRFEIEKR
jgi:tRNA 2-thiouridine synthesizing protein A